MKYVHRERSSDMILFTSITIPTNYKQRKKEKRGVFKKYLKNIKLVRTGWAHNPKVVSSSLTSATKIKAFTFYL